MEEYKIGAGLVFAIFAIVGVTSLGFLIGLYRLDCLLFGFKFSLILPIIIWLAIYLLIIVVLTVGVKLQRRFLDGRL